MLRYELHSHAGQVPFAQWREMGVEVPIFDKDGTMTAVNQPGLDEEVFAGLEEQGFAELYPYAAVASNNHSAEDAHGFAAAMESRLGINVFAICRAEGYRPKPNPEMGMIIAEHFGISTSELGVVGDRRLTDVSFGIELGARAIALCERVGSEDAKWVPTLRVIEAGIVGLERAIRKAHRPVGRQALPEPAR